MKKIILLAMVLALAACAGSSDSDTSKKDNTDKKAAAKEIKTDDLICPQVAILKEAEEIIDSGAGGTPGGKDYASKTRMKNVDGDCSYQDKGVDIRFTLTMTAKAGSKLKNQLYSLPYFVAIVDPHDNVISRKLVSESFDLSKDHVVEVTDPLHVFIPLTKAEVLSGPDYRVLVGFEKVAHRP